MPPIKLDDITDANKSHFSVALSAVPIDLLNVTEFHSFSDGLCDDYSFMVTVFSHGPADLMNLVGKKIIFKMAWVQGERKISGIVTQVISRGNNGGRFYFDIHFASPLYLLRLSRSNRVFTNQSVPDIVAAVLNKSGYPLNNLNMLASGPILEMVTQYDESDYDFVTRLMRRYGFVYGFVQKQNEAMLTVCNSSNEFSKKCEQHSLSYREASGQIRMTESIYGICRKQTFVTNNVRYDDYNSQRPGNLQVESIKGNKVPGFATDNRYGENYGTIADGEKLAGIRQVSLDAQRDRLIVDTDCRALRPGHILEIRNHEDFEGRYLVVSVEHKGNQNASLAYGNDVKGLTYKNQCSLLPLNQPFKAVIPENRRSPASFSAKISSEIDKDGNYEVALPFNQDGEGRPSKPTRLVQQYAGNGHGMHFPLTEGTEVVVFGENSDLDRPLILGALFNAESPSPVTAENPTENKIVTRAGNVLLMDDKQGAEKIILSTREAKNSLVLDATENAHKALLESKDGGVFVSAKSEINLSAGRDIRLHSQQDISHLALQSYLVQTYQGNIEIKSASELSMRSQNKMQFASIVGGAEFKAKQEINMQAGQDISFYTVKGDLSMQSNEGEISLQAESDITICLTGKGFIQVNQGKASLEIDVDGNLNIDANNITLSANNIVIKGNSISNN